MVLLRFLRGVKSFLINSFFIRSEMSRILIISGVFRCSALFRLVSAIFESFFDSMFFAVFRLSAHHTRVHLGTSGGRDSFFWLVYDRDERFQAMDRPHHGPRANYYGSN